MRKLSLGLIVRSASLKTIMEI